MGPGFLEKILKILFFFFSFSFSTISNFSIMNQSNHSNNNHSDPIHSDPDKNTVRNLDNHSNHTDRNPHPERSHHNPEHTDYNFNKEKDSELLGELNLPTNTQNVRTFFIFKDIPKHIEYRISDCPILSVGTVLHIDVLLRHLKDPKKTKRVQGEYIIDNAVLKYSSKQGSRHGLSQYLELIPKKKV